MSEPTREDFSLPIRNAQNLTPVDSYLSGSWEALGAGAPILVALAQICSQALVSQPTIERSDLSEAAQAILYAAKNRGIFEVKGVNSAFEASARLVAVYVEVDDETFMAFRDRNHPETTAIFIEGFRELCAGGLVHHHIHRDFSLTEQGFEMARKIHYPEVRPWLEKATEFSISESGLHD
jgi:hypothetical protein